MARGARQVSVTPCGPALATRPRMGPVVFALFVVAAAVLATGSQLRRRFALGVSLGTAGFAFLAPMASPAAACLLALLGLVQLVKIVDLAGPVEIAGWRARLLFVVSPYDTREIQPLGPTRRPLFWLPVAIAGAAAFSWLALRATHPVAAWLAGLAGFYLGAESVLGLIELAHRAGGRSTPAALDAPLLSTSVGEFWGRRWNRPVSAFLRRTHLLPLRRRRLPALGMALAFVSSAALHALPVYAA